jgi:hypothetical protein
MSYVNSGSHSFIDTKHNCNFNELRLIFEVVSIRLSYIVNIPNCSQSDNRQY